MEISKRAGSLQHERRRSAWRILPVVGCALALAACQNGVQNIFAPAPRVSTWRVVVLGGSDDLDERARAAIGAVLLRRGIATGLHDGAGSVTHILDVDLGDTAGLPAPGPSRAHNRRGAHAPPPPRPLAAAVTVSEGLDARLVPERAFHVDTAAAAASAGPGADPVAALADAIADALAPAPTRTP